MEGFFLLEFAPSCLVFDGFAAAQPNDIMLETVEGGSVALKCDILQGIPTPAIQWFADDILVEEDLADNSILIIDNGRYLFIRQLTAAQRAARYHCSVTTFEGEVLRDPNTYILSNDISQPNFIVQYLDIFPFVTADIGEPVTLVYSAAAVDSAGNSINLTLSCPSPRANIIRVKFIDHYCCSSTIRYEPSRSGVPVYVEWWHTVRHSPRFK